EANLDPDKPVHCDICGAALSAKQALDQHMRIHTGETPWVCKFPGCGCAFKQQSALTMHERTHTGDKPLECEICHKRFSESSNLSKHRRTHNVKGMHECQLCGKDFHRLDQLRRHMGTNHKDRPAEVDALLSNAKTRLQRHKVSKSKRSRARD
ncbi:metalloregulatory protein, partial [Lasius niger]